MILLINAGGSGTRLWPLSTKEFPKQFLNLVDNKSLLQSAYTRALELTPKEKIYISTSQACQSIVLEQLPYINPENIIAEPCRKDTMGSILNSTQYIASRHTGTEPIASIHSDQFIEDGTKFNQDILLGAKTSEEESKMVLMGMVPKYPGPKFGHIKKGAQFKESNLFEILAFKEKPDDQTAEQYFKSGQYLFNAGSFIASYSIFKDLVSKYAPEWLENLTQLENATNQKQRDEIYEAFERVAIDVALIERAEGLLVLAQSYSWIDLGSFDDIYGVNSKDKEQNSFSDEKEQVLKLGSKRNYIKNTEIGKPIAVVGMEDVIIVNTPKGLLVAKMDQAQAVKKISEALEG